jgi:enhancing lycopene biosynthesis protein 2
MAAKVGVILSGCGVMDGSEIQEAVSILIALDRAGATAVCYAPNIPQAQTLNHLTRKPHPHPRNVLEESARIARGKIHDLATARAADLDALIFPGGYGAAKNLCTFAADGASCRVNADVERILVDMHQAHKPIGLACIAPVIAARVFGKLGLKPTLTIGTDPTTAAAIESMGGKHQNVGETDIAIDEKNRLVSTPCYMNTVGPATVFEGASKMVEAVLRMCGDK